MRDGLAHCVARFDSWLASVGMKTCQPFSTKSPMLRGPNPLHPKAMTADERLEEIAFILAVGFVRLKARQSSRLSGQPEQRCVDFLHDQSGHETPTHRRPA
jgi:hypothetical protein